jgi:hypothetical protein
MRSLRQRLRKLLKTIKTECTLCTDIQRNGKRAPNQVLTTSNIPDLHKHKDGKGPRFNPVSKTQMEDSKPPTRPAAPGEEMPGHPHTPC